MVPFDAASDRRTESRERVEVIVFNFPQSVIRAAAGENFYLLDTKAFLRCAPACLVSMAAASCRSRAVSGATVIRPVIKRNIREKTCPANHTADNYLFTLLYGSKMYLMHPVFEVLDGSSVGINTTKVQTVV